MQQPQTPTSSTPIELKTPPSTGPVLLDAKLLPLISGAGPNGGWCKLY